MKRLLRGLFLVILALGLFGCQPKIDVSTNPQDADLSAFHPEVVAGKGFAIQPDVRVFTLYAFLNGVAGWDQENGDGFTPQRKELREDIQARLAKVDAGKVKSWQSFYTSHKLIAHQYLYYTMALGAPPEFAYIVPLELVKYPEYLRKLDGFNKVLADFYTQINLKDIYEQHYRAQMMEEVHKYDPQRIQQQVDAIYQYLRLDRASLETYDVVIVPVPYDSHYDANALIFEKRLYIVEGPGSNDYGLNIHEYLHLLMDDLIPEDFAGQKGKYEAIWRDNRNAHIVKNSYGSAHVYVEECMVRALDNRIRIQLEPGSGSRIRSNMAQEVSEGLVLEDDFFNALEKFEQNPGTDARAFFTDTLKSVAAEY